MAPIDRTKDENHVGVVRHDIDMAGSYLQNAANVARNGKLPDYIVTQIELLILSIHGMEHVLARIDKSNHDDYKDAFDPMHELRG